MTSLFRAGNEWNIPKKYFIMEKTNLYRIREVFQWSGLTD